MTLGPPAVAAAIDRGDVAQYLEALFLVYFVMILVRIILSWVRQFRPLPSNRVLDPIVAFIEESVDPYLNVFRRFIPPLGGGGMQLDLSPILAILLLLAVERVVVGLVAG